MMHMSIDNVTITVKNGTIPMEEAEAYAQRGRELYGDKLTEIIVTLDHFDEDMIELEYKWQEKPFHRLRRITGYLVGTLDRWNNGKRAEEHDRVKHGVQKSSHE